MITLLIIDSFTRISSHGHTNLCTLPRVIFKFLLTYLALPSLPSSFPFSLPPSCPSLPLFLPICLQSHLCSPYSFHFSLFAILNIFFPFCNFLLNLFFLFFSSATSQVFIEIYTIWFQFYLNASVSFSRIKSNNFHLMILIYR